MAEKSPGLKASHEPGARAHAGQARLERQPTPTASFASVWRGNGGPAGLGAALEAAGPTARSEALTQLQRERGNLDVQRLLAVQPAEYFDEEDHFGGGGDTDTIGFALPEGYWGEASGSTAGAAEMNPLERLWSGYTGASSAWREGKREARQSGISGLGGAAAQFGGGVRSASDTLLGGLGEAGSAIWNGVPGSAAGYEDDVLSRLGAAGSALGSGVSGAASQFGGGVVGAGEQLWGGATSAAGNLWEGATGAAGELGGAAEDVWDYFTS